MIQYWNRYTQTVETEKVYGESAMRFLYENPVGAWLTDRVVSSPWISAIYGLAQDTALSSKKITKFIQDFEIKMEEFETPSFRSFNDFFIRKFKSGVRPFTTEGEGLPAPCEARYLAFEKIDSSVKFPVKAEALNLSKLLGGKDKAEPFLGGALWIARLCPTDYHRYHYPDDGVTRKSRTIAGLYHSVNPVALKKQPEIFVTNERRVSILETKNYGKMAFVEVGALMVGKIVQTHAEHLPFYRGDEKGYFLFGGSTVILAAEPGRVKPSADLLEKTKQKQETFVRLGDVIGT